MRTAIALERTLLAWVRTAMALLTFGFTVGTILRSLIEKGIVVGMRPHAPRNFGLTLILLGLFGLLGGIFEYRGAMKALRATGFLPRRSTTMTIAVLLVIMGVLLAIGVLTRLGPY